MFRNVYLFTQFISVYIIFHFHVCSLMSNKVLCKLLFMFEVWEHLSRLGISSSLAVGITSGSWRCHWGLCTGVLVHILEQGVADPSCIGKGKDTGHVVNVHGCISACLELVLTSKHHHSMELLASVLLLLLLLCLHWWDGNPLGVLLGKIVLYYHGMGCCLLRSHHLLQMSNSGTQSWDCQVIEVSMLDLWQVWKTDCHLLKHDTGAVLYVEEWKYLSFHSHFHILHLLRQVLILKHCLGCSQSDLIIFPLIWSLDAGKNCCRRRLCKPIQ